MQTAILVLLAYIIGSTPAGVMVTRHLSGVDIRRHGSGNTGTANAIRVSGWKTGLVVMVIDILKGALPVLAAQSLSLAPWAVALVGLAAVLGHNWSLFLRLGGGKGIATSLGVVLALAPWVALGLLAVWFVVVALTRYSSLASLTALAASPLLVWVLHQPAAALYFTCAAVPLGFYRHRANISRLMSGTESRITGQGGGKSV